MILDQSVFFGTADIHDRHRDMRVDVDNMSYEVSGLNRIALYSMQTLLTCPGAVFAGVTGT